jgi:hypothetical protein
VVLDPVDPPELLEFEEPEPPGLLEFEEPEPPPPQPASAVAISNTVNA